MAKTKAISKKALVIVESPAKAKTINKYLGDDFVVKASMGHVRDLPERNFGIDLTADFRPTYETLRTRAKVLKELRTLASSADEVYLATDLDREGEAIAWHLAEALNLPEDRIKRVIFNEITRTAIQEAFNHPHHIDLDRVNAQQARRILDRIVGYELSPLLWKKIAKGLSAGRVQSVAVRLIVEREREIRAFVPDESWKVTTYLSGDPGAADKLRQPWRELTAADVTQKDAQRWLADNGCFRAELAELAGKPWNATTAQETRAVVEALGVRVDQIRRTPWADYKHLNLEQAAIEGALDPARAPRLAVSELSTKRTTSRPPAPFTTASLQQQAANQLRFPAARTMRTAQGLYEGVDITGEGPVGLITYMRTDSTNLSKDSLNSVRGFIKSQFGQRYVPDEPNFFGKRQERAQEAHEAIRPTDPHRTPDSIRKFLTDEQFRLYDLIWRRFVACQMPPAEWDSTSVSVTCETKLGPARFAGNGRKLVFDGFMKVAGVSSDDQILPPLAEGKPVGLLDLEPKQQWTSPPARYTEASLVKALESEGIGRPSTYASIIETIQDRGYVEQDDRKFYPSALGELVTDKLVQHFPKIMDIKFTSYMEDELDKIEDAHLDWVHVLHEFYDPFRELLTAAGDEMEMARSQPSEYACSECGSPMVYRWSKTGRFLACSGYPKCKSTRNVNRDGKPIEIKHADSACQTCGKPMVLRQSKSGYFLGCSGYPDCRTTVECDDHGQPLKLVTEEELRRTCDQCGQGTMVVKRKGRRAFLGCNAYPNCKNTASLPEGVRLERKPAPPPEEAGLNCDKCKRAMVIRSGKRGKFLACSGFPKCRNAKPLEKLEELKAAAAARGETPVSLAAAGGGAKAARVTYTPEGDPPPGFAWTRTGRPVVEVMPEDHTLPCPECGSTMELKRGRFGPFFSCGNFPRCRFNANLRGEAKKQAEELLPAPVRPKPIPTDIPCEECGQPMLVRQGPRGRFLGCSGYPKCKSTQELPPGFNVEAMAAEPAGAK
ncbi:DNA topoisomerase 1 [Phycisphaerae bacterium RAS1]|nr:DNA topoisomerase 1 [Phycisphaerae bacterium RAS1]